MLLLRFNVDDAAAKKKKRRKNKKKRKKGRQRPEAPPEGCPAGTKPCGASCIAATTCCGECSAGAQCCEGTCIPAVECCARCREGEQCCAGICISKLECCGGCPGEQLCCAGECFPENLCCSGVVRCRGTCCLAGQSCADPGFGCVNGVLEPGDPCDPDQPAACDSGVCGCDGDDCFCRFETCSPTRCSISDNDCCQGRCVLGGDVGSCTSGNVN